MKCKRVRLGDPELLTERRLAVADASAAETMFRHDFRLASLSEPSTAD
jgi:hypothetical protein